jgi:hypothetical protein
MDSWSLCEVVNLSFFHKIVQIYCTRNTTPYSAAGGARHLWNVGEEQANSIQMTVVRIVNVNNNHWVAVMVDAAQLTIRYGDSLGGNDTKVKAAIAWWINTHIPHEFVEEDLPIVHQQDTHSCLIFAANMAGHFILPAQIPLLQPLKKESLCSCMLLSATSSW